MSRRAVGGSPQNWAARQVALSARAPLQCGRNRSGLRRREGRAEEAFERAVSVSVELSVGNARVRLTRIAEHDRGWLAGVGTSTMAHSRNEVGVAVRYHRTDLQRGRARLGQGPCGQRCASACIAASVCARLSRVVEMKPEACVARNSRRASAQRERESSRINLLFCCSPSLRSTSQNTACVIAWPIGMR